MFDKQGTQWKALCEKHAKEIMICPCWIVSKQDCEECNVEVKA